MDTVREAVGIFRGPDELQGAIDELLSSGFDRSELSLLASEAGINPVLSSALQLGLSLVFGFEARALHVASLKRAGFRETGLIEATTLEAAELEYFSRRRLVATASRHTAFIPHADDTLGIFGNV